MKSGNFESSQKIAGNAEGARRPTAGDEGCEVRAQNLAPLLHPEGGRRARGRVPPFIEKLPNFVFCIAGEASATCPRTYADEVREITYKDLSAITRKVDLSRLASEDKEFKEQWVRSYHKTNQDMFSRRTIVPLQFGTIVEEDEEIERFLASGYLHIKSVMENVRDCCEFTVQVAWALPAVLQEIALDEVFEAGTSKMEIGKRLFAVAQQKRAALCSDFEKKLDGLGFASIEGKITGETLIFNRKYLVPLSAEKGLDAVLAQLGRDHKPYLEFKYFGPQPPYSFVPLEFKKSNFELIDWARNVLNLPDQATVSDVKTAFRELTMKHHPDKNSGKKSSGSQFEQVVDSYRILAAYCKSQVNSPGQDGMKHSFRRETVEQTFMVSART